MQRDFRGAGGKLAISVGEDNRLRSQAYALDDPWVVARNESGPRSEPATVVVPLWYRLLRPMRPDRPPPGTMGTRGTLRDASTPVACRLGAERSLVQIQSPRSSARSWASSKDAFKDEHPPTGDQMLQVIRQALDPFLRLLLPALEVHDLRDQNVIG